MEIQEGPTWDEGVKIKEFGALSEDAETDILIIGGGMTGLTSAYLLQKAGKKVMLVEKNKIGFGATGVTTAFLTEIIDTGLSKLIRMYGKEKTRLILKSHEEAIEKIESIIEENKIECEFARSSYVSFADSERERNALREEEKAAGELGLPMRFKTDSDLRFLNSGYLETSNQAKFHPLKYLSALTNILSNKGVAIHEKTEVTEIDGNGPYMVKTKTGTIKAKQVIVATYAPFDKKLFFNKAFYKSYVIEAEIRLGALKEGMYQDSKDPYHYFRVDKMNGKDRLIIGGEDHREDIPVDESKNYQALMEYLEKILEGISYTIMRRWNGQILEPVDGLAFIGTLSDKNIFYATGFSGNGMTYSTIAASVIVDLITGKLNPYTVLYDASRKPTMKNLASKAMDYGSEFIHGALKNSLKYRKKKL